MRAAIRAKKLEEQAIAKLIENHDFEGLKHHLSDRKSEALLDPELIKAAFREFLASDGKAMTNSQQIIIILHDYVYDHVRKGKYSNSKDHKLVMELFDLHERTIAHKSPKVASIVTQEIAQEYSKKMDAFRKNTTQLREDFKKDSLALLNNKARQCMDVATLGKLPTDTNYFLYITGYNEWLINKRIAELVAALPDEFFGMNNDYQIQAKELMVNKLLYTQLDLNDDEKFITFVLELFDKIFGAFKETALAEQEPPRGIALRDPKDLSFKELKDMSFNLNHTTEANLNNIAVNYKRYITHLQNELDNNRSLGVLKEYLKVIEQVNTIVDAKRDPILLSIQDHIKANFDKDPMLAVMELKEQQEAALISILKGPEGDKLEANGLTKRQAFGLKLYQEAYNERRELPDVQKQFVQQFLVSALGNMKLNSALTDADSDLKYFSFKSKNPEIFLKSVDKLIALQEKINRGESIEETDKLSFKEYGILISYVDLEKDFNNLNDKGLLVDSDQLSKLYEGIKRCAPLVKSINQDIEKETIDKTESGDLLLNNILRRASLLNARLNTRESFSVHITKHLHTTKLVQMDPNQSYSISHVRGGGARTEGFDIKTYLYSDLYKINIAPLIKPEMVDKLRSHYKDNYAEQVNKIYREIEYDLHNDAKARFTTATLRDDIEYVATWFAEFIGYLGHNKLTSSGLEAVHKDIMGGAKEKNKMLCSEFAAKATVAAFVELNEKLKAALGITEDVINMPFGEKERFSKMHPGRLLEVLQKAGCIQEIERTATEKQYLSFADKVTDSRTQGTENVRE